MTTSDAYRDLVEELERRASWGDDFAGRCLAALALINTGWRYGDPDPDDPSPEGEGVIPFPIQRAA